LTSWSYTAAPGFVLRVGVRGPEPKLGRDRGTDMEVKEPSLMGRVLDTRAASP